MNTTNASIMKENILKVKPALAAIKSNKKGIIILSGGLDSTTLAYYLKNKGYNLVALTFDYGQTHKKEINYAKQTCWKLNIPFYIFEVIFPFESALLGTSNIPTEDYSVRTQRRTIVPNRNMIFLSYAVAYAEDLGLNKVFYAAHKNDKVIYPDCRPQFVRKISQAASAATHNKVKIIAPFLSKYKQGIVKIGDKLGVPFKETWSCYFGREKPCGRCGTCRERLRAFKKSNLIDPLEYDSN